MGNAVEITVTSKKLPTYVEPAAEELPMFAESRVHQRSSGDPYPNRVVIAINKGEPEEREYTCICLENKYIRLEILPQLGGRIFSAYDKVNDYDFFYRQHVIKPALIGMLGSWISGGCEFNWPCHHRPSTFLPVDWQIERDEDGGGTVWLSEHDPLDRMKGMVGIHLKPDAARLETRIRVYNRTPLRHSFLWWENAAVPVNEKYRIFFPPDVTYVNFHYRKDNTTYPIASGTYNGIRLGEGVHIDHHAETRQPTSFFSAPTKEPFFGGYDEGKGRGVVHVADPFTSTGKKLFTWAYNQLSENWERALTDADGPYAELMAGSYSNNQPDFAWLEAYETKTFSQSWYPIGELGVPVCATLEAALSVEGRVIRLQTTKEQMGAKLEIDGKCVDCPALLPGRPWTISMAEAMAEEPKEIRLSDCNGKELLHYRKTDASFVPLPEILPDNPDLSSLKTAWECYQAGVHVEQYRDPVAWPEMYWQEALRREPGHAPSLIALARLRLGQQRYQEAKDYAERAWNSVTMRNNNPESGELPYLLGLIYEALEQPEKAEDWHQKAAWNQDARSRAMTRLGCLYGRMGRMGKMAWAAREALQADPRNSRAACLLIRAQGDTKAVKALLRQDPLDHLARLLLQWAELGEIDWKDFYRPLSSDPSLTALDIAQDLLEEGDRSLAAGLLEHLEKPTILSAVVCAYLQGRKEVKLEGLPIGSAFPLRKIEADALQYVIGHQIGHGQPEDLLACMKYHHKEYKEAEILWERALKKRPKDAGLLRDLAVVSYSHTDKDGRKRASVLLEQARLADPHSEQLLWEAAYVALRNGYAPETVLEWFRKTDPVSIRDDIMIEWVRALNMADRSEEALDLMEEHRFIPCEGGEHAVAEQYMFACHNIGRKILIQDRVSEALGWFRRAQRFPGNLGAALWNEGLLAPHRYFEALCLEKLGEFEAAREIWKDLTSIERGYFSNFYFAELPCWQALCCKRLGRDTEARRLLSGQIHAYEKALDSRVPGFFKATPFFISYIEPAEEQKKAACHWQLSMAYWAAGDERWKKHADICLQYDPTNLYASLLYRQGGML
ncbi:MAG TPA: DUF5107 domain-containing protein [Candidatus Eisenbergiella merdipullorum]|uniref:DUF5107 domain-containing protein n=1 Tax=Candidatus Eisenbergiella merdipullorum TaxID=2838553 RepID=A0A9D2I603_9FIRM|nr:DUF5107 domain-containing protein [Candidatus Eisenbergiella merdipullorum]